MPHPNEALIEKFYQSFSHGDYKGMAECYHPDVEFSDPVFQDLKGDRARAMWQMLTGRSKDFRLTYSDVKANDQTGSGYWEAFYTFSASNRPVHNKVTSSFTFKDGLIYRHHDSFNLWEWAGMALGWQGRLLGWLPPFQAAIRKKAINGLDQFMAAQKQATSNKP